MEAEKSDANLKKFLDALTGKTEETTTAAQKATTAKPTEAPTTTAEARIK